MSAGNRFLKKPLQAGGQPKEDLAYHDSRRHLMKSTAVFSGHIGAVAPSIPVAERWITGWVISRYWI
jgi:hypothetical protein